MSKISGRLEEKDAGRKVEEEDQVISDCYSIPSKQLIALPPPCTPPSLCPAVNTPSQLLSLYYPSLFFTPPPPSALDTTFHLFRFSSPWRDVRLPFRRSRRQKQQRPLTIPRRPERARNCLMSSHLGGRTRRSARARKSGV